MSLHTAKLVRDALRGWSTRLRTPTVHPRLLAERIAEEMNDEADALETGVADLPDLLSRIISVCEETRDDNGETIAESDHAPLINELRAALKGLQS